MLLKMKAISLFKRNNSASSKETKNPRKIFYFLNKFQITILSLILMEYNITHSPTL